MSLTQILDKRGRFEIGSKNYPYCLKAMRLTSDEFVKSRIHQVLGVKFYVLR